MKVMIEPKMIRPRNPTIADFFKMNVLGAGLAVPPVHERSPADEPATERFDFARQSLLSDGDFSKGGITGSFLGVLSSGDFLPPFSFPPRQSDIFDTYPYRFAN